MAEKWKPDFTVTKAEIRTARSGLIIVSWQTVSAGFGELTLYRDKSTKKWMFDSECMSRRFCRDVLAKLADGIDDLCWLDASEKAGEL